MVVVKNNGHFFERNAKCFCGSGKKIKKCHSTVEPDSKLANIYLDYLSFDKAVVNSGVPNRCPKGCSKCCNYLFDVSENEFLFILDEILRTGGKPLVNYYKQKAMENEIYLQLNFPKVIKKIESNMPRNTNALTLFSYMMDDSDWDRSKSCIFLDDGRCSIYSVRPVVCRKYGICNTCPISNNKSLVIDSLEDVGSIVYDGSAIIKRPYPLFYWFSHFLREGYKELTLKKLRMIREKSELQYGEFTSLLLG